MHGVDMSTDKPDLFGKIDALLGKRAPDALLDKSLEFEDFPLLTEVVDASDQTVRPEEGERRAQERRLTDRREQDRRLGDRRQDGRRAGDRRPPGPEPLSSGIGKEAGAEMARMVDAMERRLTDMFIRQQLRMEEAVRKAIRDEMARHREEDV